MNRALVRLLPFAALLASACVSADNIRPIKPSEAEGIEALMVVVSDFADSGQRAIAPTLRDALRSALDDGRIRFGDVTEEGVRGFVSGDDMYLESSDSYALADLQQNPFAFCRGLMVLYHEGVHLTQDITASNLQESEDEAYLEAHHLQRWLLARSLRGEASYSGFPKGPKEQLECTFWVRKAVTRSVGGVCPCNRIFHRVSAHLKSKPGTVQGLVEPGESLDRVRFVDDGAGAVVGRWRIAGRFDGVDRVEAATVTRRFPEEAPIGSTPEWKEYLRSAASVELLVGWYDIEATKGEVDVDRWNEQGIVPRIVGIDEGGVELELRVDGLPGLWRLAYQPVFFTVHPFSPEL